MVRGMKLSQMQLVMREEYNFHARYDLTVYLDLRDWSFDQKTKTEEVNERISRSSRNGNGSRRPR